jgi:hypothetical protein
VLDLSKWLVIGVLSKAENIFFQLILPCPVHHDGDNRFCPTQRHTQPWTLCVGDRMTGACVV